MSAPPDSDSQATEAQMRAIHSTLSNKDALQIFNMAAEGITASLEAVAANKLSKKRYYVRLRELIILGLIYKANGVYRQTALGTVVYENQVKNLKQILFKRSSIQTLQDIKDKKEVVNRGQVDVISSQVLRDLEATLGLSNLKPVRLFRTWNELSSEAALSIVSANSEVYVASRYVDFRAAEAALDAAKRGCKIHILHSARSGFSPKVQLIGNLMTHPKAIAVFKDLTQNPNIKMKEAEVPYSFIVIDACKVGIEIVNPLDPTSFFLGLLFENPELSQKLITRVDQLFGEAGQESISDNLTNTSSSTQSN
jgi:hypothetical protein